MKTFYITTPIYYSSGNVHIGNSFSTILADVAARYHRLKGDDTFYLTGMDEHGQKIELAAKAQNITPQELVDRIAVETQGLWKQLNISNDDFIRTSEARHYQVVQDVFERLLANGDIYLDEYEGDYCIYDEAFFTKSQLLEDGLCPDCGRPTTKIKEEGYFLRLKKYQDRLLAYIKANPDSVQPQTRRNEVIAFIEQGLEDLCVSRTSFTWGIQVKSNPKHVVYVWIDALMNYLSALGYGTKDDAMYQKYWVNGDKVVHVVGKDILRFHAIYWPIMLMAIGVDIKFNLYAHGWVLMKEGKMSKSKNNVIYPLTVAKRYGVDALRLYLIKEMPYANDALFTHELFVSKYNELLANDLGNLVSRTISMINKYFNGVVNKTTVPNQYSENLESVIEDSISKYIKAFDELQFQNGLNAVWEIINRANKYIDETTPWTLAKDESRAEELRAVLYHLYEVLRMVAIMITPVMPDTAKIIFDELGSKLNKFSDLKYGVTETATVIEKPIVLFKRLDWKEEESNAL